MHHQESWEGWPIRHLPHHITDVVYKLRLSMVFSWSREKELHFIVFYQSSLLLKLLGTQ